MRKNSQTLAGIEIAMLQSKAMLLERELNDDDDEGEGDNDTNNDDNINTNTAHDDNNHSHQGHVANAFVEGAGRDYNGAYIHNTSNINNLENPSSTLSMDTHADLSNQTLSATLQEQLDDESEGSMVSTTNPSNPTMNTATSVSVPSSSLVQPNTTTSDNQNHESAETIDSSSSRLQIDTPTSSLSILLPELPPPTSSSSSSSSTSTSSQSYVDITASPPSEYKRPVDAYQPRRGSAAGLRDTTNPLSLSPPAPSPLLDAPRLGATAPPGPQPEFEVWRPPKPGPSKISKKVRNRKHSETPLPPAHLTISTSGGSNSSSSSNSSLLGSNGDETSSQGCSQPSPPSGRSPTDSISQAKTENDETITSSDIGNDLPPGHEHVPSMEPRGMSITRARSLPSPPDS